MGAPPVVMSYCRDVATTLRAILGESLSGLYLHGSGAMGGWVGELSDVDLLAVSDQPLTVDEKQAVASALTSSDLPAPGVGLEFSLVCTESFEPLTPTPGFELHITTGVETKVIDGAGHPGDPDLVMHYALCRERGVAILGPRPHVIFPNVPRPMLLQALAAEVVWGLKQAPLRYAVLNACRAWAFAEGGRLLSKVEGAEWALERGLEVDAVHGALAVQRGEDAVIDRGAAGRLVARARTALLGEPESMRANEFQ